MASRTQSIPVILCGKTLEVGEKVAPLVKPEIEVIQFINSFEDCKTNFPDLLAGRGPKVPILNNVGTHDYSRAPRAIIFGRAFKPEEVKELNRLFQHSSSTPVAWIAGDPTVKPPAHPGPDYAEQAAANVKRALQQWMDQGARSSDIIYY
ncbi:hypothetical protein F4777DRAFT_520860 [Nemania sp. FL0916]|nr:hypothetical protein F4777DRAFT_520860 [Nemania sp. FL0916]